MSCMMLSPAHIATVAHGLSYLLNQSEMCQLSAADELRDALALADTRTIFCMTTAESTPFCTGTTKRRMKGAIRSSRTKPTKCQPCRTMCRTCCTVWTTTSIIFSMLISSNS